MSEQVVRIASDHFNPAHATLRVGEQITWINDDTAEHTVTCDDRNQTGAFASGPIAPGQSFVAFPDFPGAFVYHCQRCPELRGMLEVIPRLP